MLFDRIFPKTKKKHLPIHQGNTDIKVSSKNYVQDIFLTSQDKQSTQPQGEQEQSCSPASSVSTGQVQNQLGQSLVLQRQSCFLARRRLS